MLCENLADIKVSVVLKIFFSDFKKASSFAVSSLVFL